MKTELVRHPKIVVKKSPIHGYGVYAGAEIAKGEIIEECYAITSLINDMGPPFQDYVFGDKRIFAIPLGFGCIYNHSYSPNAEFTLHEHEPIVTFAAIRSIKKGEEIFVSYGSDWFNKRNTKAIGYETLVLKRQIKHITLIILRFSLIAILLYSLHYLISMS